MASVARCYNMDAMVKSFIERNGACNVIYLGAGLETAYDRIKSATATFYEVDLPEVIEARRTALGARPNEVLIGGDMFDMKWADTIDKNAPAILVVSGVFQYFMEDVVVRFIGDIQKTFKKAELVFDATNETGIRYANRYVQKTGNTDAPMYFYVNDGAAFAKKTGTTLLEERGFFTDARRILAKKLELYTRIAMRVVDNKKRAILLRLKVGPVA